MLNEVITAPATFKNETFNGRTVLDYRVKRSGAVFEGCDFRGNGRGNGNYSVYVPPDARPMATFVNCTLREADKALVQYCRFVDCHFTDQEDGVFCQEMGYVEIQGCEFRRLGGLPGDHPDCVQMGKGKNLRVTGCKAYAENPLNSFAFIETAFGPVSDVTITNNEIHGPTVQNGVWLWEDKHGKPRRCWVDYNYGKGINSRLVIGNFAGWRDMVGPNNRMLDA